MARRNRCRPQRGPVDARRSPDRQLGGLGAPHTRAPAGGGAAPDHADARNAAIGEALERYAASTCPLPEIEPDCMRGRRRSRSGSTRSRSTASSNGHPGFPILEAYGRGAPLTPAFGTVDNRDVVVPLALVTLDPHRSMLATSSGLAADTSPLRALLRAVQELVERALVTTWPHGRGPSGAEPPPASSRPSKNAGGAVVCLDITPAYSPHPVAAVAGNLPLRGRPRLSPGAACRSRWDEAVDKAWRESAQGTVFAGEMRRRQPASCRSSGGHVVDFDAAFYTFHPDRWASLPIWGGPVPIHRPTRRSSARRRSNSATSSPGRRLGVGTPTTASSRPSMSPMSDCESSVALAPQLTPIHADHRWPYLGGSAADLALRYPWAKANASFPIDAPHPLG